MTASGVQSCSKAATEFFMPTVHIAVKKLLRICRKAAKLRFVKKEREISRLQKNKKNQTERNQKHAVV